MHKITFYVPESHLDLVKTAMFDAGAGKIGHYDQCCWQAKGVGQFRPLTGSQPFSGHLNQVQQDDEYLVEMVCADDLLKAAIAALKSAHPYETPAYAAWELSDV